jgi:hypothetical protein
MSSHSGQARGVVQFFIWWPSARYAPSVRQLSSDEVVPPLEPVGVVSSAVRAVVESRGVVFVEETEYGAPGPIQWAVVALDNGAQYLLQDHYRRPTPYVVISGQIGAEPPAVLCRWFASELGLSESDFSWIAEGWPKS